MLTNDIVSFKQLDPDLFARNLTLNSDAAPDIMFGLRKGSSTSSVKY